MLTKRLATLRQVILTLALAPAALAGDFAINWHTIDGGGGTSTGGGFELAGTIGQHDAAPAMTGGTFSLLGGFWPGAGSAPGTPCPADFDNSGAVDVKDLLFLLGAWGPCPKKGACPADFDNSSAVDVKDLLFLLGIWGPCP